MTNVVEQGEYEHGSWVENPCETEKKCYDTDTFVSLKDTKYQRD